jgi:uncharacterized membrane protein
MTKRILILIIGLTFLNYYPIFGQSDSITENQAKVDSIDKAELDKEKQLQMKLLNNERLRIEKAIEEQHEARKKQKLIIYAGYLIFFLMIGFLIGLLIRNKKLRKSLKDRND